MGGDSIVDRVGADDFAARLMRLASQPGDASLRLRIAEELDAKGESAAPILAAFVNLTGHDDDAGLPCLCKRCLPSAPASAEAGGESFTQSFAVVGSRVLHYWQLSHQHRGQVRDSVTSALQARLARRKK